MELLDAVPFELVEHHILPAMPPNALAALLNTCRPLHDYSVRHKMWSALKRQWQPGCWGCGRAAPLPPDAVFVRFEHSSHECELGRRRGPCWFSHQPGDCWAFCSEACFWKHTTVGGNHAWPEGLEFDCATHEARAWAYDGYLGCSALFSLPAWPHPVRTEPSLATFRELVACFPDMLARHLIPHLAPRDVASLLLAVGPSARPHVRTWWDHYRRAHVGTARCMQCGGDGGAVSDASLACLLVRESLVCPECRAVQSWADRGAILWLHNYRCKWSSRRNVAHVAGKGRLDLQGFDCEACGVPMDTEPYAESIHPVVVLRVARLDASQ